LIDEQSNKMGKRWIFFIVVNTRKMIKDEGPMLGNLEHVSKNWSFIAKQASQVRQLQNATM